MKQTLLSLLLVCCCSALHAEARRLVLVTATPELQQVQLSRKEIRKLYLGRTIIKDGKRLVPLINTSDSLGYQIFLQKIMLMSANSYERFLLSKVFRSGGVRPERFTSPPALIHSLQAQPGTITYMWARHSHDDSHLLTLGELWRGVVE